MQALAACLVVFASAKVGRKADPAVWSPVYSEEAPDPPSALPAATATFSIDSVGKASPISKPVHKSAARKTDLQPSRKMFGEEVESFADLEHDIAAASSHVAAAPAAPAARKTELQPRRKLFGEEGERVAAAAAASASMAQVAFAEDVLLNKVIEKILAKPPARHSEPLASGKVFGEEAVTARPLAGSFEALEHSIAAARGAKRTSFVDLDAEVAKAAQPRVADLEKRAAGDRTAGWASELETAAEPAPLKAAAASSHAAAESFAQLEGDMASWRAGADRRDMEAAPAKRTASRKAVPAAPSKAFGEEVVD